jgi:hypothetical protein
MGTRWQLPNLRHVRIAQPAPRIVAESPQQARSVSVVRARTCSAEPEFGAQKILNHTYNLLNSVSKLTTIVLLDPGKFAL